VPIDDDRRPDSRPPPERVAHDVGERAGCLRVVVDPPVPTGVEDEPCERALPERMSSPDRDVAAAPVPPADDRDGLVGLVAAERRGVCRNQPTDLGDDGFEDIVRRRALRDEGRDSPEGRLLVRQPAEAVAGEAFAMAVPVSSVKPMRRVSVSAGTRQPGSAPTPIIPHTSPSTTIGAAATPTIGMSAVARAAPAIVPGSAE
jgi:hypothetical protein